MKIKRYFEITLPPGIFGILVICFILLKISHQIDWSWLYVLSPIIISTIISSYFNIKKLCKNKETEDEN